MKKILFFLLLAFPVIFAGCGEETTTTVIGEGDITPPPTEKNLTISGISESYFIPIADSTHVSPKSHYITFYINNKTANNYNDVQIKPVFTDENNHELTAADGLNYTVSISDDPKNFTAGSFHTATIRITYTGTQKTNIKFKVEISSSNMPTETFNFNTANFLTYLQAFLYTNDGTSESLYPITADTVVQANTTETSKIIFLNSLELSMKVMLQGTNTGSGKVILPTNPLTLNSGVTFTPCTNKTSSGTISTGTFYISQRGTCYLEIQSTAADKWTYNPVNSSGTEVGNIGYKPTDAININIQ